MKKQRKFSDPRIKTALLIALGSLLFGPMAIAQEQQVTLSSRNIKIEQAFSEIQQQTGLVIAVNHTALNTDRRVSLSNASGKAKEVLTNLLADTGQTFEQSGNYVVLRPASRSQAQPQSPAGPAAQNTSVATAVPTQPAQQPAAASAPESLAAPAPVWATAAAEEVSVAPHAGWEAIPAIVAGPQPDGFRKQRLPLFSIKTNLLDDATTSFNLGVEFRLADQWTLHLPVSYNPWTFSNNKQWRHLSVAPEGRFWLREAFNGHFFGAHGLYSFFNAGNIDMPLGIFPDLEDYRYEGNLYGTGFSYGYQWILGNRWGLEATVGMGYFYADYKQYDCANCGQEMGRGYKHYFGPTKLGLSLIFFIK